MKPENCKALSQTIFFQNYKTSDRERITTGLKVQFCILSLNLLTFPGLFLFKFLWYFKKKSLIVMKADF